MMSDKEKVLDFDDLPEEAKKELSNGKEEGENECLTQA